MAVDQDQTRVEVSKRERGHEGRIPNEARGGMERCIRFQDDEQNANEAQQNMNKVAKSTTVNFFNFVTNVVCAWEPHMN